MIIYVKTDRIVLSIFYTLYVYDPVYYYARLPFRNAMMYLRRYLLYILFRNTLVQIRANLAAEFRIYYALAGYPRKNLMQTVLYGLYVYKLSDIIFGGFFPFFVPGLGYIVSNIKRERYNLVRIGIIRPFSYNCAYVRSKGVLDLQKLHIIYFIGLVRDGNLRADCRYIAVYLQRRFRFLL